MMWNYRVLRESDLEDPKTFSYRIIEAYYYADGSIYGWCDSGKSILDWPDLEDLVGTVKKLLPLAFDKPTLVRVEGTDTLAEIKE